MTIATNKDLIRTALFRRNKSNALSMKAIRYSTSMQPQTIRGAINALRCEGNPICCCPDGYYWETNREAVLAYANSLMLKAKGIMRAVNGLKKFAKFK